MKTGKIVAKHLYISQVNGVTIGPDLVGNQMSGSAIQGLSRAMYEQYTFTKERITSLDWVTYPILRFKDSAEGHAGQRPSGRLHHDQPRRLHDGQEPRYRREQGQHGGVRAGLEPVRLGRAADRSDRLGHRERVLRCHGCPHPPGADEPDARPRCPQGSAGSSNDPGFDGRALRGPPSFSGSAHVPQALVRPRRGASAVAVAQGAPAADLSTIYVDYHDDCTFRLTNDAGRDGHPGRSRATYQVAISTTEPFASYHLRRSTTSPPARATSTSG